jgi:hypothetical protein
VTGFDRPREELDAAREAEEDRLAALDKAERALNACAADALVAWRWYLEAIDDYEPWEYEDVIWTLAGQLMDARGLPRKLP